MALEGVGTEKAAIMSQESQSLTIFRVKLQNQRFKWRKRSDVSAIKDIDLTFDLCTLKGILVLMHL